MDSWSVRCKGSNPGLVTGDWRLKWGSLVGLTSYPVGLCSLWVVAVRIGLNCRTPYGVQRTRELAVGKRHGVSVCASKLQTSQQFSLKYSGLSHLQ